MLGFSIGQTLLLAALLGYFVHRLDRKGARVAEHGQHIEGMIAATFLTAHRALSRRR